MSSGDSVVSADESPAFSGHQSRLARPRCFPFCLRCPRAAHGGRPRLSAPSPTRGCRAPAELQPPAEREGLGDTCRAPRPRRARKTHRSDEVPGPPADVRPVRPSSENGSACEGERSGPRRWPAHARVFSDACLRESGQVARIRRCRRPENPRFLGVGRSARRVALRRSCSVLNRAWLLAGWDRRGPAGSDGHRQGQRIVRATLVTSHAAGGGGRITAGCGHGREEPGGSPAPWGRAWPCPASVSRRNAGASQCTEREHGTHTHARARHLLSGGTW